MLATYRFVRSSVLNVAAALGLISILVFTASLVFDLRAHNVISGSMEPGIPTGSLLLTRPITAAEIREGDVITTERPNGDGLVTHRVQDIREISGDNGIYEMIMRGDANDSDDPRPYTVSEAGIYLIHIPVLGFVATMLQTRAGILAGIALACILLIFFLFPGRPPEEDVGARPRADGSDATGPVSRGGTAAAPPAASRGAASRGSASRGSASRGRRGSRRGRHDPSDSLDLLDRLGPQERLGPQGQLAPLGPLVRQGPPVPLGPPDPLAVAPDPGHATGRPDPGEHAPLPSRAPSPPDPALVELGLYGDPAPIGDSVLADPALGNPAPGSSGLRASGPDSVVRDPALLGDSAHGDPAPDPVPAARGPLHG